MPPSLEEINANVDKLGAAWEAFKSANDERLKEIEKRNVNDPLQLEKLNKIGDFMDSTKTALDGLTAKSTDLEKALARGVKAGPDNGGEEITPEKKAYYDAFKNYLIQGGDEAHLKDLHKKALSVASDPDGGYLVTPVMSSTIIKTINEYSPIRALAAVETISSDTLELLEDRGTFTSGWTTEQGTRSDTANSQFGKKSIPTHEMYAQPNATQKMLDDAAMNVEQWIASKAAESFAIREATAFVSGDGAGKPRGFLTFAAGTSWGQIEQVNSGSSGAVTADGLINLVYSLKEAYTRGASFLMKRATTAAVRLLKESTTNAYIWQPGLQAGQPASLLGYPTYEAVDMPTIAANSLSIAFANWKQAYQIVDRKGITLLRDPYTGKPFVKFYFTKRVGGDVTNFEAIKLQKLA